jgi:hypothetical protein
VAVSKSFALFALLAPSLAVADDTASIAFRQAQDLENAGKWAEACPLYEASYHADPQIGVLLHLAICHEHVGKLASAWAEYTDAAELAHRKGDNRESLAQQSADALKPKLAHLHLNPPAAPPTGLAVRRDNVDITVLVGTDMPIDAGEHELVANAPGFLEWKKSVTIGALPATITLDIPALEKAPDAALPPKVEPKDGNLAITTQPDAHIYLDDQEVATGHYEHAIKPGRHTLRVNAPGMRLYQTEIYVENGENRSVDVPLEKEYVPPPPENLPSFELGASAAPGVKLRHDNPGVLAYRIETAFRFGRRVNFGAYVELGSIDTSNACGFDMAGPMPSSSFDIGTHYQLNACNFVMPGLQLQIHVFPPNHAFDPYFGLAPGFRFGLVKYTPYTTSIAAPPQEETFLAIVTGARAGFDYHPYPEFMGWAIGGFLDAEVEVFGDEACKQCGNNKDGRQALWLLFGLRSTVAF